MIATLDRLQALIAKLEKLEQSFDPFDTFLAGGRPEFFELNEVRLLKRLAQEHLDEAEEVLIEGDSSI